MPSIAPWLNPPNFVGAAAAGAASGLGIRRANQEATEAADRLQLAYDQLAENERKANLQAQNHLALQKASLALRGQQMDAMRAYHEDQIDARNRQIDNAAAYHQGTLDARAAHESGLEDRFSRREGDIADRFNTRQENLDQTREDKAKAADALQSRFDRAQALREAQFNAGPGKLSPGDYALLDAKKTELKRTQAAIDKMDEAGGPAKGALFGLLPWKDQRPAYKALKDRADQLTSDISNMQTPKQQLLQSNPPQAVPTPPPIHDESPADYVWDPESRRIKKLQQ